MIPSSCGEASSWNLSVMLAFYVGATVGFGVPFPSHWWAPGDSQGTPRVHVPTLNVLHQWCWHKLIEKRPHLKRVWPLPLLEFQKGPRKQSLFMEALLQNFQRCIFQLPNLILRNGWIPKLAFSFPQLRRLSQMLGGWWSVYKRLSRPGESSLSGPLPWG